MNNKIVVILQVFLLMCGALFAQSADMEPDWVHRQKPTPKNDTYFFQVIGIDNVASQAAAEDAAKNIATDYAIRARKNWVNVNTLENTEDVQRVAINLACPPYIETVNGKTTYYFLYQISQGKDVPRFEPCDCFNKSVGMGDINRDKDLRRRAIKHIQARAIPASVLCPGAGQLVKGQYLKGGLILGGEVIGIAGIITSFSMKASNDRLVKQDAKHGTTYAQRADTWQNVGYGFIGLAAAVYVYSLIDVIASRPTDAAINKAMESLTFAPVYSPQSGLGLAMQIKF